MSTAHIDADERLHIKRWVSEQETRAAALAASEARRYVGLIRLGIQAESEKALSLVRACGLKVPERSHHG